MARTPPITRQTRQPRIEKLQRSVRQTLTKKGFGKWADGIIVDGKLGPLTLKMTRLTGSMLGMSARQLRKITDGEISHYAEMVIEHDRSRTPAMKFRAKRRAKHFARMRHELNHPPTHEGVVTFDGHPCAGWIADCLQKARDHGWGGVLVSGFRTPEYSESLCFAMCGAPSCPGRCAGRATNHACPSSYTCKKYEGAADVSDYIRFGQVCRELGLPLQNALPSTDPVHYSNSGH